jgi:hypothetical protein
VLGADADGFVPMAAMPNGHNKNPCRVATEAPLPAYTRVTNVITGTGLNSLNTAGIDGITNLAVGVWQLGLSPLMETGVSIIRNKGDVGRTLEELHALHRQWATALTQGARDFVHTFKTGVSFTDQVNAGQEAQGKLEGNIYVDPLTRTYDDAHKKFLAALADHEANPGSRAAKILYQSFRKWVLASGRFVFHFQSAIDSAFTKASQTMVSNILSFRRARDLGLTREHLQSVMDESMRLAESHRAYLTDVVGLTSKNEIAIEVQNALMGAYHQALADNGVQGMETLVDEAVADFQDWIGTGETSSVTPIGRGTKALTTYIHNFPLPIAGFIPAVRTVGNFMDALLWTAPGIGLYRAIKWRGKTTAERNHVFPNIKADWQFHRRQAVALLTNAASLGIMALLNANKDKEDDEKDFWWTGSFPAFDKAEQRRWERNGWTENTLIMGKLRIRLDRGFGQTIFLPMMMGSMLFEATDGLDGKEAAQNTMDLAEALIPGVAQLKGRFKSTESVYGLRSLAENQAASMVPFSALLNTQKRLAPKIDKKNTEATIWQNSPFYVDTDAPGVVVFKSPLGEPLAQDADPYGWVKKIGSPIYMTPETPGRDSAKKAIAADFAKQNYSGGAAPLDTFKTHLQKAGVPYSSALYKTWKEARIDAFVKDYTRQRGRVLRSDNYKSTVGSIWSDAGKRADRELGIRVRD